MGCSSNKSGVAWNISEQYICGIKRKKNLQDITGSHTIKNGKIFKTHLENRNGKYEPCNTNKSSLCCKQVIEASTLQKLPSTATIHYISQSQL